MHRLAASITPLHRIPSQKNEVPRCAHAGVTIHATFLPGAVQASSVRLSQADIVFGHCTSSIKSFSIHANLRGHS
jgi:hypothetical protein